MPNTHETLTSLFDDIADAIREKTGAADELVADAFPDAIRAILTGASTAITTLYGSDQTQATLFTGLSFAPKHVFFFCTDGVNLTPGLMSTILWKPTGQTSSQRVGIGVSTGFGVVLSRGTTSGLNVTPTAQSYSVTYESNGRAEWKLTAGKLYCAVAVG